MIISFLHEWNGYSPFLHEWNGHLIPAGMEWFYSIPAGLKWPLHSCRNIYLYIGGKIMTWLSKVFTNYPPNTSVLWYFWLNTSNIIMQYMKRLVVAIIDKIILNFNMIFCNNWPTKYLIDFHTLFWNLMRLFCNPICTHCFIKAVGMNHLLLFYI